jgi:Mrp family chromosome partitioning ATPase
MSSLGEYLREAPAPKEKRAIPFPTDVGSALPPVVTPYDEQIRTLVQQLFFARESGLVRNVGFAPAEAPAQTASLCLEVARTLAAAGQYDVGLIDASLGLSPLPDELHLSNPGRAEAPWPLARRLWLVPRHNWWPESGLPPVPDHNLERLREVMTEFDCSILYCAPVSWLTARIGRACDGLVLVLTAGKTRRLVAAQVKDCIGKMHIPLLGSVLVERRFPVPEGLYRNL